MADDGTIDRALTAELSRTGSDPEAIVERALPETPARPPRGIPEALGQVVLVLQGGGALGAYQVGVYQALHEAGVEPDWVIGTSIGAINASLIAGNAPADRLDAAAASSGGGCSTIPLPTRSPRSRSSARRPPTSPTIAQGLPAFFQPNPSAFFGLHDAARSRGRAGYYDTAPLAKTLGELVDFSRGQRRRHPAHGRRRQRPHQRDALLRQPRRAPRSCATSWPRAPCPRPSRRSRIDGEFFWDGGILSNTPVEAVFDDNPRRTRWSSRSTSGTRTAAEPDTIWQVMSRQKDIQYSSRAVSHIARQKQIHRLRHVIAELARRLPEPSGPSTDGAGARRLRLPDADARRAPARPVPRRRGPHEGHRFQPRRHPPGARRRATPTPCGCSRREPWSGEFDPVEGFILHEARRGVMMTAG